MKKIIIKLLPLFIIELIAPYISIIDEIGKNQYYRIYDSKDKGAGLLIIKQRK